MPAWVHTAEVNYSPRNLEGWGVFSHGFTLGKDSPSASRMCKALADSAFVASKTDAELAAFVKQGRPIWDPDNTSGIDMPPKGGNPALSDGELAEIITYIRSLQEESSPGDA